MTTDQLIASVLRDIWTNFYEPHSHDFFRDKPQLVRAICHYAFLCEQRGWNPDLEFVNCEILRLLQVARASTTKIRYLPAWLHESIRKNVNQRAEEIQQARQETPKVISRALANIRKVELIREPTNVEVLAKLYKSIARGKRKSHIDRKQLKLI